MTRDARPCRKLKREENEDNERTKKKDRPEKRLRLNKKK
jgi:hypothetical protein